MHNSVIIVAGGSGTRMGTEIPKQFLSIGGMPVLMQTINNFYRFDPSLQIILVLPRNETERWKALCTIHHFATIHQIVSGGVTRFQSVKNGLSQISDSNLVAIHDGVRPLVSHETLSRCFQCASEKGTAIPVLPIHESVRQGDMIHSIPVDRAQYFTVQTPQVFKLSILQEGYKQVWHPSFTDDASVVEHMGIEVNLVMGNRENIKITYPEDLQIANFLLGTISGS